MEQKRKIRSVLLACIFLFCVVGCATTPFSSTSGSLYHDRVIAVGDVHGNYDGLVEILRETSLIDERNQWTGGNTLLVQVGDLLDRDVHHREVMDLLMSLEGQAVSAGGRVVVLMGNHEALNLIGSMEYVNPEVYKSFETPGSPDKQAAAFERWRAFFGPGSEARGVSPEELKQQWMETHPPGFVEYMEAFEPDGVYGKWLRSCPAMFRYGGTIFVHAGISEKYADLTPDVVNKGVREELEQYDRIKSLLIENGVAEPYFSMVEIDAVLRGILASETEGALAPSLARDFPEMEAAKPFLETFFETSSMMGDNGPMWYRGLARSSDEELTAFLPDWLAANKAWRVVVGHTPSADGSIKSRLGESIFLIDTGMASKYYRNGRPSALEIRDDDVSAAYGAGECIVFPPARIEYETELVWVDEEGTPLPFEDEAGILAFLETADMLDEPEVINTGVNRPLKKSLEKNGKRANAIFRHQSETALPVSLAGSGLESRYFRDGWQGEICAFAINRMLGMNNLPPTVFRTFEGREGSLQLWAEQTMADRQRAIDNILPPEPEPWNRQMADMRVFDNLINNTDRNQTNILIDENWRLIPIDHTRSFARDRTLPNPERVVRCSRGLWHALRHLDQAEARKRLAPYLLPKEIDALFVRQEILIRSIRDLIRRNGEEKVLF